MHLVRVTRRLQSSTIIETSFLVTEEIQSPHSLARLVASSLQDVYAKDNWRILPIDLSLQGLGAIVLRIEIDNDIFVRTYLVSQTPMEIVDTSLHSLEERWNMYQLTIKSQTYTIEAVSENHAWRIFVDDPDAKRRTIPCRSEATITFLSHIN